MEKEKCNQKHVINQTWPWCCHFYTLTKKTSRGEKCEAEKRWQNKSEFEGNICFSFSIKPACQCLPGHFVSYPDRWVVVTLWDFGSKFLELDG